MSDERDVRGPEAGAEGSAAARGGDTGAEGAEETRRRDDAAANDEQRRREAVEQLKRLRVADVVEEMMIGLVTVGYQKLGLTEQTRELRDLADARLAIETLRAWLDVVARERGEEGLADLRGTVAAMQLSYARAAVEPAPPAAEAGSGETGTVDDDASASGASAD